MRFDAHGQPHPDPREPVRWMILLGATVVLLTLAAGLYRWAVSPMASASTSPPRSAVASSASGSDPTAQAAQIAAYQALATAFAPTPVPTNTPTPVPRPTTRPTVAPMLCGVTARSGEVCEWPAFTPTPDPGPPWCGTPEPGTECRWRGQGGG